MSRFRILAVAAIAALALLAAPAAARAQSEWAIFTDGKPDSIAWASADVVARGGVVGPTSGNYGSSSVWITDAGFASYRIGCSLHSAAGPIIAFSGGVILTIQAPGLPPYQQMVPIFSGANGADLSWESIILLAPPGSTVTATFTGVGMTATYKMFVAAAVDITIISGVPRP